MKNNSNQNETKVSRRDFTWVGLVGLGVCAAGLGMKGCSERSEIRDDVQKIVSDFRVSTNKIISEINKDLAAKNGSVDTQGELVNQVKNLITQRQAVLLFAAQLENFERHIDTNFITVALLDGESKESLVKKVDDYCTTTYAKIESISLNPEELQKGFNLGNVIEDLKLGNYVLSATYGGKGDFQLRVQKAQSPETAQSR